MHGKELAQALRSGKRIYGTLIISTSPKWIEPIEKKTAIHHPSRLGAQRWPNASRLVSGGRVASLGCSTWWGESPLR